MKTKLLTMTSLLAVLALSAFGAHPAQASMVAGWDFSQYFADGILSIDGAAYTDTLSANYSDLDPTSGAGAESANFGTLYLNGQFGSTNVMAGSGSEPILPSVAVGGSLSSNIGAPGGSLDFDTWSIVQNEGQLYANSLALTGAGAASAVFGADLSALTSIGSDWVLTFGARTFSGVSELGIDFSTDGVAYTSLGTVALTNLDTLYSVNLGAASSETGFVRFDFVTPGTGGAGQQFIDNVAINANVALVPEPGTALLCGLGMIGLGIAGRRRPARV
jgi:hypothetical protein